MATLIEEYRAIDTVYSEDEARAAAEKIRQANDEPVILRAMVISDWNDERRAREILLELIAEARAGVAGVLDGKIQANARDLSAIERSLNKAQSIVMIQRALSE